MKFIHLPLLLLLFYTACEKAEKTEPETQKAPIVDQDTFPPEAALVTVTLEEIIQDDGGALKVNIVSVDNLGRTAPSPAEGSSMTLKLSGLEMESDNYVAGDSLSLMIEYQKMPSMGQDEATNNWKLIKIN